MAVDTATLVETTVDCAAAVVTIFVGVLGCDALLVSPGSPPSSDVGSDEVLSADDDDDDDAVVDAAATDDS